MAMLLFLAALLLPAVQNLRQAGYKAETINNLKQICLARGDPSPSGSRRQRHRLA